MIGEKLTEIRKSKGIKRKDLAKKLKTSYETVRRWEKGKAEIPMHQLDKLCEILNIPPSYLLGEESQTIEYPIGSIANREKVQATKILPIGTNYIFLEIQDDGMGFLQIGKGDFAIIDTSDVDINEKFVFAFSINNKIVCRKAKVFKNKIVVISHILNNCDISIFHKSEVEVIGKVVRIIKRL